MNLTSWDAAQKKVRQWEADGTTKGAERMKLAEAIARYEADCVVRNLAPSTQLPINVLLERLQTFADLRGLSYLSSIGVDELTQFWGTWMTWSPIVKLKNLERLRAFFRFCVRLKWIPDSPAQLIKRPIVEPPEVTVFSKEELAKIHAAISRPIMRAFVLTLEHTGLRISDAVQLRKQDIVDGKLCIRTKKTKSTVWLPLPPNLLSALAEIKTANTSFYFWTGESKLSTVIGSKRRGIDKLLKRAGVPGNPHKFRHTLATNLLLNGTRPAIVAKILGNSARVVEKYYDHWISAHQAQLEAELQKTWEQPKLVRVK
jgi:integrase